jgi:hypothetical protein
MFLYAERLLVNDVSGVHPWRINLMRLDLGNVDLTLADYWNEMGIYVEYLYDKVMTAMRYHVKGQLSIIHTMSEYVLLLLTTHHKPQLRTLIPDLRDLQVSVTFRLNATMSHFCVT